MAAYNLACRDGYKYPGHETYVVDILPVAAGLATTASDQTLSLFDPLRLSQGPTSKITTDHGNLTAAKAYSVADSVICTTGENGTVSVWDLRQEPARAQAMQIGGAAAFSFFTTTKFEPFTEENFQEKTVRHYYHWHVQMRRTLSPLALS
jgi:WD40 repeat protein